MLSGRFSEITVRLQLRCVWPAGTHFARKQLANDQMRCGFERDAETLRTNNH
jgi:hypothetical protein